jgi:Arc/MetJ-type ribon-helix-helix transcriptional regulator
VIHIIRTNVLSGVYASESEYIESILLSESLFAPIEEDELTHWINTEGVRRLRAMEADPSRFLTHDQVFDFLDDGDAVKAG